MSFVSPPPSMVVSVATSLLLSVAKPNVWGFASSGKSLLCGGLDLEKPLKVGGSCSLSLAWADVSFRVCGTSAVEAHVSVLQSAARVAVAAWLAWLWRAADGRVAFRPPGACVAGWKAESARGDGARRTAARSLEA